jgi:CheY-like chemotaxis protein
MVLPTAAPSVTLILRVDFPPDVAVLRAWLERLHAGEADLPRVRGVLTGAVATLELRSAHLPGPVTVDVEVLGHARGSQEGVAVRIPLQRAADYVHLRTLLESVGGVARPPSFRMLLVEDNPHIVQMFSHALRKTFGPKEADVTVEAVGNGLEAMERLEVDPAPDLVVTDLYMPVMDGFHLVEKMRLLERTRDTPVIVISAAGEDAESRARQLGVSAFLHKPVQLAAIVDAVRRLLASHA